MSRHVSDPPTNTAQSLGGDVRFATGCATLSSRCRDETSVSVTGNERAFRTPEYTKGANCADDETRDTQSRSLNAQSSTKTDLPSRSRSEGDIRRGVRPLIPGHSASVGTDANRDGSSHQTRSGKSFKDQIIGANDYAPEIVLQSKSDLFSDGTRAGECPYGSESNQALCYDQGSALPSDRAGGQHRAPCAADAAHEGDADEEEDKVTDSNAAVTLCISAHELASLAWQAGELDRFVGAEEIDELILSAVDYAEDDLTAGREVTIPLRIIQEARALVLARHDGELAARERQEAALLADEIEAGDRDREGAVIPYPTYRGA